MTKFIILLAFVLTSYNVSHGNDGSFQMPNDSELKKQALDQLISQDSSSSIPEDAIKSLGLDPRPPAAIERDFYEGVLSPVETDVTNKADGPKYADIAPFQNMYTKEFAPADKAYDEAMNGDMWKHVNIDKGPGARSYKKDEYKEKLRLFDSLLPGYLAKGRDSAEDF